MVINNKFIQVICITEVHQLVFNILPTQPMILMLLQEFVMQMIMHGYVMNGVMIKDIMVNGLPKFLHLLTTVVGKWEFLWELI